VTPIAEPDRAKRRSAAVEAARVTLYTRPGCHLCNEAREALQALGGFELREVDIDSDERLMRAYLERIPVVEVEGRVISELVFDRDAFTRALHTVGS
jgi:glutaredoxin